MVGKARSSPGGFFFQHGDRHSSLVVRPVRAEAIARKLKLATA